MSQEYIEISERTVSEAVTAACQKLGVPSDHLEYEVIEQGKAGFLGIGARAAKIRARVKKGEEEFSILDASAIISDVMHGVEGKEEEKKASPSGAVEQKKNGGSARKGNGSPKRVTAADGQDDGGARVSRDPAQKAEEDTGDGAGDSAENGNIPFVSSQEETQDGEAGGEMESAYGRRRAYGREYSEDDYPRRRGRGRRESRDYGDRGEKTGYRDGIRGGRKPRRADYPGREEPAGFALPKNTGEGHAYRRRNPVPNLDDTQVEEIRRRASAFLADVFDAMELEAEVESSYDRENGILSLDMKGDNMGVLIGKRGQTLDSLQYLTSLVVNKGMEGYIHVKADTENYRERRKRTLENLAKNIASRVKRNQESVALEPMNPYERRIIHSALQGDRYVTTYSEGDEPYRKVVVTMKEER